MAKTNTRFRPHQGIIKFNQLQAQNAMLMELLFPSPYGDCLI